MCKRVHVQVKAMWLVKVGMPWNLHGVPYGRRNTLGVIVFDTSNRWSAKRYNHLSYMHNEERMLMHITILVMAIARVYYVERGT